MRRIVFLLLALFLGLMGSSPRVRAEGPPGLLTRIAAYDGATTTFVRQGDILYAGNGLKVSVFDIHDPVHPQHLADSILLPEVVRDLAVAGDFLFVADDAAGLWVFRMESDHRLSLARTWLADETVTHVAAEGDRAFVSGWGPDAQYLTAIAVNDEQVNIVSRLEVNPDTLALEVVGNVLYLADNNEFFTYDVADLTAMRELGSYRYPPMESFLDMKVVDGVAYIHAQDTSAGPISELITVDVSDATAPKELTSLDLPFNAYRLDLQASVLYITGQQGIHLYDVSDPSSPRHLAAYLTPSETLLATPGLLFTADVNRIEIADIHSPREPVRLAVIPKFGRVRSMAVQGTRLYTVSHDGTFRIFDVADIQRPRLLGEDAPPAGSDIPAFVVVDDVVYQAYARYDRDQLINSYALRVLDISDPAHPHEIGRYPLTVMPHRVAYADHRIYLATGIHLLVFDVTQPERPDLLAFALAPSTLDDMIAGNGILYATTRYTGLSVWDIHDDFLPRIISRLPTPGRSSRELARYQDRIIVADGRAGLAFVDVSQPQAPTIVNTYPCQYETLNVATSGAKLFVLCRGLYHTDAAIHAYRLIRPDTPTELAVTSVDAWSQASGRPFFHALAAQDDLVFYNGDYAGVEVFRLIPPERTQQLWLPLTMLQNSLRSSLISTTK